MSKKRGSIVSSAILEMSRLVRYAASPAIPGEKVPHAIARAARRLGISKGRTESFWYGKARSVAPEELETARAIALHRARDAELLRHEYRRAVEILGRLETSLAVIDADFHSETIGAARDMARRATGTGDSSAEDVTLPPVDGGGL